MDSGEGAQGDKGRTPRFHSATLLVGLLGVAVISFSLSMDERPTAAQGDPAQELYPDREAWAPESSGSANISVFVFRDGDRSHVYDLEDPPLAGIAVRLWRPNGSVVTRRANTSGFANFTNAPGDPNMDVSSPGEYVFEVVPPNRWTVTTANAQQIVRFRRADTSRAGIVASEVPSAVGLAPSPTVSGKAMVRTTDGDLQPATGARVTLRTAGAGPATRVTQTVDGEGRYSANVRPGLWSIEVVGSNGGRADRREVAVSAGPVVVSTVVVGEEGDRQGTGVRRLVDFEGITSADLTKVPNGVAGLSWKDLIVTHKTFYGGEGYVNAAVSGDYVGYNTSGYPVRVAHPEGFDFVGGFFGSAWLSAEGEQLQIRAWRGDVPVFSDEFHLSALGPQWFDAEYNDITRLEIATAHHWQFVVDDLVFRVSEALGEVPEAGG